MDFWTLSVIQYKGRDRSCGKVEIYGCFTTKMHLFIHRNVFRIFWWNTAFIKFVSAPTVITLLLVTAFNFWLFPKLKYPLKAKGFQDAEETKQNIARQMLAIRKAEWIQSGKTILNPINKSVSMMFLKWGQSVPIGSYFFYLQGHLIANYQYHLSIILYVNLFLNFILKWLVLLINWKLLSIQLF